jgi:hypothetical protein
MDSLGNNPTSPSHAVISPTPSRSPRNSVRHGVMSPASTSANNNNNSTNTHTDGIHKLLAERMATGGGALCNDQNGLCLGYEGSIDASKSGIYTSIAKLASLLDTTIDGSSSNNKKNTIKKGNNEVPLVSIQTEQATLLVKEYGGRTIVFRVPAEDQVDNNNGSGGDNDLTNNAANNGVDASGVGGGNDDE